MINRKTASALTVVMLLTMGAGIAFINNDDAEGTWAGSGAPLASLTMNAYQLWQAYDGGNGVDTYFVGYGTYVYVPNAQPATDTDYLVIQVQSDYGAGDTAGLTLNTSIDTLSGMINKSNLGEIEITIEYRDGQASTSEDITITLAVIDVTSTQLNPWTVLDLPANIFNEWGSYGLSGNPFYVLVGSSVSITQATFSSSGTSLEYGVSDVTSGFGLSIPAGTGNLTGTLSQTGTITVSTYVTDGVDIEEQDVSIIVIDNSHADVRMISGETWTYTPTTNIQSVISISGTATSWVSLVNGVISGTAPSVASVGQQYELIITANSTQPVQTITQTVTFTVDPPIELTVASDPQVIQAEAGSVDVVSSNFEGGSRSIYSISGTAGYNINATTGVISYTSPVDGYVTITATSPYSYASGATNSASAGMMFNVRDSGQTGTVPEAVLNLYVDENTSDQTFTVAWGTYIDLTWDSDDIAGSTTISGLNTGLLTSGNRVYGYISYTTGPTSGTAVINVGSPDTIHVTLNIVDLSNTSATYYPELKMPANLGYQGMSPLYVMVGGSVLITPVTIGGTTYGVDSVSPGYGLSVSNGVLSGTITQAGTITVVVDEADFEITAVPAVVLTASVSESTIYLVTGKTVPNTPAEGVTLSHNNVGQGTYTWSIVGTNNTGVTVTAGGVLGGTPGAVGTYSITLRCTSNVGGYVQTADVTLGVVIVPVLAFTSVPPFAVS